MNNLEKQAQAVWAASSTTAKKTILTEMVDSFKHKAKQDIFYEQIGSIIHPTRLDQLAANIMLCDTDAVVS
tara:strand:+ start:51608 stop:51820 length:213 start_codon:yes stop_codon:yes gene_type:complete